uniref:SCP domain-containing protein n=1 Tax=Trichuris muris TaxID=70415 RepID=A0A5S6Q9J5_TRIMR
MQSCCRIPGAPPEVLAGQIAERAAKNWILARPGHVTSLLQNTTPFVPKGYRELGTSNVAADDWDNAQRWIHVNCKFVSRTPSAFHRSCRTRYVQM